MRQRLAAFVAALCVVPLAAACSDDASHARAETNADAQTASLPGAAANAFNGGAAAGRTASASAPLATPVIHYPPEDEADDASGATAASAHPASNPG
ncbi:hypothetical protein [Burkholderia oklahomensis]|uniref:hypothetical protein n=1 Tax=Burkholderia oklahomensis TaxID=342113 RepID=UPI00016A7843|nr:hypothetical protein [Burkholderia oklahomensis]AJX30895.1 putative lipoprotein [Burkholderia oklahomensis C6786]AOI47347.1 hypothetical protein WI23_17085 [Burkholderia oklahomensis C6786]KUY61884.1 hypothetical protein WI23_12020 [Burkholderia oklahomensis C6786]MBI0359938.1 hypothetical protein [Burkholderia oklahomensis]SUW59324.1 Uncharacterised protein [Burkholderia oklahomensis]